MVKYAEPDNNGNIVVTPSLEPDDMGMFDVGNEFMDEDFVAKLD